MRKILRVKVTKRAIVTYEYDYEYTDNKEVTVRGEGLPSLKAVKKLLDGRIKHLTNESYKIKLEKDLVVTK